MNWIKVVLIGFFGLSALVTVYLIGRKRDPMGLEMALVAVIMYVLIIMGIINC